MATIDPARFKEKAGPLPIWGWSLIVAGVAYVIYARNKKKAAATAAATQTTSVNSQLPTQSSSSPYDLTGASITALYDVNNSLGVLNSNLQSQTNQKQLSPVGVGNWLKDRTQQTPVATSSQPVVQGQKASTLVAQLQAQYDNISNHLIAAQNQYNAAPNESNASLVHSYQGMLQQAAQDLGDAQTYSQANPDMTGAGYILAPAQGAGSTSAEGPNQVNNPAWMLPLSIVNAPIGRTVGR